MIDLRIWDSKDGEGEGMTGRRTGTRTFEGEKKDVVFDSGDRSQATRCCNDNRRRLR